MNSWSVGKRRAAGGERERGRRVVAYCLALPLFLRTSHVGAQAENANGIIYAVNFTGQKNISSRVLGRVAGLRPGATWSPAVAAEVSARLRAWPYLAAVREPTVSRRADGQIEVFFVVTERPTIGRIDFTTSGGVDAARLRTVVRLRRGDPYHEESVQRVEDDLTEYCRSDGFLTAHVESVVSAPRPDLRDVVFVVREGTRVHLTDVTLHGVLEVPEREALAVLRNRPRRFFGLVSKGYYLPRLVEGDLEALLQFYRARGFIEARVGMEELRFNGRRTRVELVLEIREGRRFRFAGVRIEGNRLLPTALLETVVDLTPGGYYDQSLVAAGIKRLSEFYQRQTGLLPQISLPEPALDFETASVEVILEVTERPHLIVEEVKISGNERTLDRVARQDITVIPGDPFTTTEVERSLKRLRERGIFRNEEVFVHDGTDAAGKVVEFAVTEWEKSGRIDVGGGASSGAGEIGYLRLSHTNFDVLGLPRAIGDWDGAFTGGGQTLELEVIPGRKESDYRLRFEEPYFFKRDLALSLSASGGVLSRRSYDETHVRGRARLRQYLDDDRRLSLSVGYLVDLVDVDDLDVDAPALVRADAGATLLAYPRLALEWRDATPNFFSGPTGLVASLSADLADSATGSELDFWRTEARADYFIAFFDRYPDFAHKFHLNVRFGWMEGRSEDPTHIAERFFLGGPRSFRGFSYRRLGPHQGGTPVGGEAMVAGSVTYSLPLFWREVRGVAVFDWGDLESTFSRLSASRMRTAAGGGLEIRLPAIGQLDLFWVEALAQESEDRERLFGFTLGVEF